MPRPAPPTRQPLQRPFSPRLRPLLPISALAAWLAPARFARAAPQKTAPRSPYPLKPGQAFWLPELSPTGPVVAVVNLHTQHVQLYRNGIAIGYSSVSTGKRGYSTPQGRFQVLQKNRHHRSSSYNNAPMPWMVRLTWGGIAFHSGLLPGYPASHGCIRLPSAFAPHLFGSLSLGDTVAIVSQPTAAGASALTALAPITPQGQPLLQAAMLAAAPWWDETRALPAAPGSSHPDNPSILQTAPAAAAPGSASAASAASAKPAEPGTPAASGAPGASSAPAAPAPPAPAPLALLASLLQKRLFVLHQGHVLAAAPLPALNLPPGQTLPPVFTWQAPGHWQLPTAAQAAPEANAETAPEAPSTAWDTWLWQHALPADPAFTARLRQHLHPGSTLTPLAAVGDLHWAV